MGWGTLIVMAVALATDAFAVSVANGLVLAKAGVGKAVRLSGSFGLFQGLMPLIGYIAAVTFADAIRAVDHWVAFVLLAFIGGKMLWETWRGCDEDTCDDPTDLKTLLVLSVATSIDALAVGVSLAVMPKEGVLALSGGVGITVLVIGAITFALCLAGVFLGRVAGQFLGKSAQIVGGIVLIGIGTKILLEHTLLA